MKKKNPEIEKDEIIIDDLTLFLFDQIGKMSKEELFTKTGKVRRGLRANLVKKYKARKK